MRQMGAMRAGLMRLRPTMLMIVPVMLTACSEVTENGVVIDRDSCGIMAQLDGRWYSGNGGFRVIPTYRDPLGTATIPPCEDADGFGIEAVSIVGVSPKVAFAAPQYAEDIVFIAEGIGSLPPALKRLRQEPRCDDRDVPIVLNGPWLGIIGADGSTEVDMVPPYDLSMRVDEASVARYERSFVTIHVAADKGRPLTRQDVRSSLWQGGILSVTATCVDGQFWAEDVTASPPT
jgi:hypothetical protein